MSRWVAGGGGAGVSADTEITSPDGVSQSGLWMPVTRSMRPPSKVITRFPSGHGWTGGADDTTTTLFTDRTYKWATTGTGTSFAYVTSPTFTAQDWSTGTLRLVLRIDDVSKLLQVIVNITTGSGNVWQVGQLTMNQISGEWVIITVPRVQFASVVGTPVWTGVTQIQIGLKDKGGSAPVTGWLAAVELIPDLASTYPNGVFVMECDDGYPGQKSILAPVVSQRGIPVTYNVIADRFTGGSPASGLTAADLRLLQDKHGWQISCHAYAQTSHDGPTAAGQFEQDFQRQKQWLHANGLHSGVDHYALCPGTGSPVAEGAMMDALRRNFRSVRVNTGFYETSAPADPLRLRSVLFSGSGNTVANLQTNIDKSAGSGGGFIYTVHDVIAGATDGTSFGLPAQGATNLATVLDYAISKGMAFRTRADYLDGR